MSEEDQIVDAASVADELVTWAQVRQIDNDPYIKSVAEAIRTDNEINFWAEQDALKLLPSSPNVVGKKMIRFARLLAVIRNVLVFVPVAITWKAVADATSGFALFIEQNGAATVNFLEFWQNGYGILDPFWTIGNIANVDAAIIVAVIVVSLVSSSLNARGLDLNSDAEEVFENERISIGLGINRYLSSKKLASSESVNQSVLNSIDKLNASAKEMNKVAEVISSTSTQMEELLPGIEGLKASLEALLEGSSTRLESFMGQFETSLGSSSKDLLATISQMKQTVEELQKLVGTKVQDSLRRTSSGLTTVIDELETNSQQVKESSRVLQDELQSLHRKLGKLINNLEKDS